MSGSKPNRWRCVPNSPEMYRHSGHGCSPTTSISGCSMASLPGVSGSRRSFMRSQPRPSLTGDSNQAGMVLVPSDRTLTTEPAMSRFTMNCSSCSIISSSKSGSRPGCS